jgi:branched-chain amino acid transport system substrate-binding protein
MGAAKAIIIFNNSEWGQQLADAFDKKFKADSGEISMKEGVAEDQTLFSPLIGKIKTAGNTVMFLAVGPSQAGLIIKEAKKQSLRNQFLGTDNFTAQEIITAGGKTLDGVRYVVPTPKGEKTAEREAFDRIYKETFGNKEPHIFALNIYDAVMILYKTALQAGDSTAKAINILETLNYAGAGGTIQFDKNHDIQAAVYNRMVFREQHGTMARVVADNE